MNYTETVIVSALLGAFLGVAFGYTNYDFFKDEIHKSIFKGLMYVFAAGAIYFSIEEDPVLTNVFYFLPVFGWVYRHVALLVIDKKEEEEREAKYRVQREEKRMKEEEERLKHEEEEARFHKNLDPRIRKLRNKN